MSEDAANLLHGLYQPVGGVGQIFGPKVADYGASRPDYPAPLFELLRSQCGLSAGATIADVGAGTGLLTGGLLGTGASAIAVEPNAAMRGACDHALQAAPNYRSVEGCAEAMPLQDGSVDLITAAQAFHWFDVEPARSECLRVLREDGQVALIWNDRLFGDPLHVALDQVLSEDGLLSLVFSRSYMPARDSEPGRRAVDRVRDIFQALAMNNQIVVRYTTVLMLGRPLQA